MRTSLLFKTIALTLIALTALISCRALLDPSGSDPATDLDAPMIVTHRLPTPAAQLELRLRQDEIHAFPVALRADESLNASVMQEGVDVVVDLVQPDGRNALSVDTPIGRFGPELLCYVATQEGVHQIRVRAWKEGQSGDYSILLQEIRPARKEDRACSRAARLFAEAEAGGLQSDAPAAKVAELYQESIASWEESGNLLQLALAHRGLGQFWSRQGNFDRQIQSQQESLALIRQAGNPRQEIVALNILGLSYRLLGRFAEAEGFFQDALQISRQIRDPEGEATALNNRALLEATRGDTHRAVQHYQAALWLLDSLKEPRKAALTRHNLGAAYTILGHFPQARQLLHQALDVLRQEGEPDQQASSLLSIGWLHFLEGRPEQSLAFYQEALSLQSDSGNRFGQAGTLDRLASAYLELGRMKEALQTYRRASRVFEESGSLLYLAHTTANIGRLFQRWGRFEQARQELRTAAALYRRMGAHDGLAHALARLAQVEHRLGSRREALDHIEESLRLFDRRHDSARRQGARLEPVPFWRECADFYIQLLMELHDSDPQKGFAVRAFEFADVTRSRELREMLSENRIDWSREGDQSILQRRQSLAHRINAIEDRRLSLVSSEDGSADSMAALESQLHQLLLELEQVRSEIRAGHPRLAQLTDPQPLSLAEVQSLLDADTLLLSYVLGEGQSCLFSVTSESFESHRLPGRERIQRLAQAVYAGLKNSRQKRAHEQIRLTAGTLSEILLGPVRQKMQAKRLAFMGEGPLRLLAFGALPWMNSSTDRATPLIASHEVVHLPSANVLSMLRRRSQARADPSRTVAVLADPVFSADDPRLAIPSSTRSTGASPDLRRLPFSRLEAESIASLFERQKQLIALGFKARRELLTSGSLQHYRVVHIASHALLHDVHPELSGIALSRFDAQGRPMEGFLRLHEIFGLELPADLVVLSGCRTALGERVQGYGYLGLTHGFFYAGASRLIVSLWDVDDEATALFMKQLYLHLAKGLAPTAALRQAQLFMLRSERWKAPFYWAGFVMQGDWKEISLPSQQSAVDSH